MKRVWFVVFSLLICALGFAQPSAYSFTYSAGTYAQITGTSVIASGVDDSTVPITLPFAFTYCGTNYTTVSASSNGFVWMGSSTSYPWSNSMATTSYAPIICPLWDDLGTASSTGNVSWTTLGTAPNRQFVVQWFDMGWTVGSATRVNFQLVLNETTNVFKFVYGTIDPAASGSASIGFNVSPGGSGNFVSITPAATPTSSSTTANDVITGTVATYLPSGYTYTFTPPLTPGQAGSPSPATGATGVFTTLSTLNWTFSNNTNTYNLFYGPTGSMTQVVTGAAAGASGTIGSYTLPAPLTSGAAYQWRVDTINGSGTTTGVVWSFTASAVTPVGAFAEGFEGTTYPPTGWSIAVTGGSNTSATVAQATAGTYPTCTPHGDTHMLFFNSFSYASGVAVRMATPVVNLATVTSPATSFYMYQDPGYSGTTYATEGITLQITTNGANWTNLVFTPRYAAVAGWTVVNYDLSAYAGQTIGLAMNFYSCYGNNIYADDFSVYANVAQPGVAGLVGPANGGTGIITTTDLTWNTGAGAAPTGYRLYLGTDGAGTATPTNMVNGTDLGLVNSYTPTLAYLTTYYWQIVPYNLNGDAAGCPIWSFTTMGAPAVVTLLTPVDGTTNFSCNGTVSWSAVTGATGYKVYAGLTNPPTSFTTVDASVTSGVMPGYPLVPYNTTIYWSVVAFNAYGDGPMATPWSFTTQSNPAYGGGGTTSGGYYYANSTSSAAAAPSQPQYNWIDLGTPAVNYADSLSDDSSFGPIDIGYTFSFFGVDYTQVYLISNGFISFTNDSHTFSNYPIPTADIPNALIAPFWDDLNPGDDDYTTQAVYTGYDEQGNFVISYENYPQYNSSVDVNCWITFQVILKQNGVIKMQYNTCGTEMPQDACTIGIENADGTMGVQYLYNGTGGPVFDGTNPMALAFGLDATAFADAPPTSPTNIIVTTVASTNTVTLNWTASLHATSYNVYSAATPYATFPGEWTLEGSTTTTTYSQPVSVAKKYYRVTASN